MRLLLDTCVWGGASRPLSARGHDVTWVGDWPEDPGDTAILEFAHSEKRILVTLDKDFGELAIVRRMPHCGIIRLVDMSARQQANVCLAVLSRYGDELMAGAIVTASERQVRIRRAT
jgi:predicted nuclease of predicted toxin-antitoxin system